MSDDIKITKSSTADAAGDAALWQALGTPKALDLEVEFTSDNPEQLLELAESLDDLATNDWSQELEEDHGMVASVVRSSMGTPTYASDVFAGAIEPAVGNDPTLVALKNRSYGIVRQVSNRVSTVGPRTWLASIVASITLSLPSFSTVYALNPFDRSTTDNSHDLTLTESALFSQGSLWDLEAD